MTAPASAKLERLLNLTAALLATERLLPAAEIAAKVAGYASGKEAFRRTFERDKSELRRMGIPLTVGAVPGSDPPVEGYRIHPRDYYLADPGLEADERAALHLAARAVRLEETSADTAFWALGGLPPGNDAAPELAVIPSDENLVVLYRAICERSAISFRHRGDLRTVEPVQLRFVRGHWYLGGQDRHRQAWRNFRLDRIGDLTAGPAGEFEPVPASPGDLERPPWEIGEGAAVAQLTVDAELADWALVQTSEGLRHERRPDGSVWLEVSVANPDALVDFVLGLLEHAELLGPPALRELLLGRLRACAAAGGETARPTPPPRTSSGSSGAGPESGRRAAAAGRPGHRTLTSAERMHRLLQLIPWVAGRGGAELAEITERFDYPADELLGDLQQVVFMVGVPPYTPDALIEVEVVESWVQINFADYFRRPLRLTPPQAITLLVAATSLLGVTGDSALDRGLAKIAQVLGVNATEALEVHLGAGGSEILATLQEACGSHRAAAIRYYSYDRDAVGDRVIEPHRTFAHDGAWYVRAYCRTARHERTFRLDRVSAAQLTDESFEPPREPVPAVSWEPSADAPWVELALGPAAHWVLDYHPTTRRNWDGDTCVARFEVGGIAWLERLLLRLGPAARVTGGSGIPADPGGSAARRILARYGE
ncbi:MAG: WYL domain-containing protein [Acidimicrobiia bacterium]|nr:WYL domain-containing protein [Acidimicrobiia bacterium]